MSQPKQPGDTPANPSGVRTGITIAISGIAFAIAPLAISLIAAAFGSNIGVVLHWFTLLTAPLGALTAIIGLVIAARSASKETVHLRGKLRATNIESMPAPAPGFVRALRSTYLTGVVIIAASALMRVTVFQPNSGILTLIDLTPIALAAFLAKKSFTTPTAMSFLQFHRTQAIICWGGLLLSGPIGLFGALSMFDFIGEEEIVISQIIGTAVTGLIPAAACISSIVFASTIKHIYLRSASRGKDIQ